MLYLLYFGGLIALLTIGFFLGRNKALAIRSNGTHMHSQPAQYGWFVGLYAILPGIVIGVIGGFANLSGVGIPGIGVVGLALVLSIASLFLMQGKVTPELRGRNNVENFIKGLLIFSSVVSVLTTFGILLSILFEAIHFFSLEETSVFYFLFGSQWFPEGTPPLFGAIPLFAGTFYITIIAMAVALPVGLLSAIYMSEYATEKVRNRIKPVLEILAGIPTVVYGFFAAITVAPFMVSVFEGLGMGIKFENALAPGIVMGVMIIPFISSLSDDVIRSVPQHMRQGSLALGMNKAETIKFVVLPSALPGIIAATLLGVSRALGETMIVVMAAGLQANLTWNPLETMTTVTVRIVDAMTGDQEFSSPETLSAFALGLVLFIVTLVINVISVQVIRAYHKKYKVSNL